MRVGQRVCLCACLHATSVQDELERDRESLAGACDRDYMRVGREWSSSHRGRVYFSVHNECERIGSERLR